MIPESHLSTLPVILVRIVLPFSLRAIFCYFTHENLMQSSNQLRGTFLCAWYMLALFPMLGPTAIPNANHLKPTH